MIECDRSAFLLLVNLNQIFIIIELHKYLLDLPHLWTTIIAGTPSSAAAVGGSVVFCVSAWIVAVGVDLFSSCSSALLVEDVTILLLLTIGTAIGVFKATTTSTTSTAGVGGAPSREEAAPLLLI